MFGVVSLHEILHETKMKIEVGVVLKLDFNKAYDKVNLTLLFSCHKARGFYDLWCRWIQQVVSSGTVNVRLNNLAEPYISKG